MGRIYVGVDFDGVLCRQEWPRIGEEMPGAVKFLRWLGEREHGRILWTCRTGDHLEQALAWLEERGFPPQWWDAINDNAARNVVKYGGTTRKVYFDVLVDDTAVGFPLLGGQPDWWTIQAVITSRAGRTERS